MKYAEVINNTVKHIHTGLPRSYLNISNFFALDTESLKDLSWSGNPGIYFLDYEEQGIPENMPIDAFLSGPVYNIDFQNSKVIGQYTVETIAPENYVPNNISARQIRLWLLQNGISLQMVADAIATIEDPVTRDSVSIEWEYAPYIERSHPMLIPLAQALGLSEADIDRGFVEASSI